MSYTLKVKETGWEGVDCIHLAQDREQWWSLVNIIMIKNTTSLITSNM
jgi:hypothetical protein